VRGCSYCEIASPCSTQVGTSLQPSLVVIFGPCGNRFGLKAQSGRCVPPRHCPRLSLGLLTWESIWPPASCTAASAPLLHGIYVNLTFAAFSIMRVSTSSVSLDCAPPILNSVAAAALRKSPAVL